MHTLTTIVDYAMTMSDSFSVVNKQNVHNLIKKKSNKKNAFQTTQVDCTKGDWICYRITQKLIDLQWSVIDLRSRAMSDNLVFCGIPDSRDENCEDVMREFLN